MLRGGEGNAGGSGGRLGRRDRSGGGLGWGGGRGGSGCGGRRVTVLFGYEAVSLAGDGLDEAGLGGIVAQGLADFPNRGVDAVLGIDEDVLAPEALDDFLARDDGAVFFPSRRSSSMGMRSSFRTRPLRRSSKREGSRSNSPNLWIQAGTLHPRGESGNYSIDVRDLHRTCSVCNDLRIHLGFTESSPRLYCAGAVFRA